MTAADTRLRVAETIYRRTLARGLSLRGLGRAARLSHPTITAVMAGRVAVRLDTLVALAHALDCDLDIRLRPRDVRQALEGRS